MNEELDLAYMSIETLKNRINVLEEELRIVKIERDRLNDQYHKNALSDYHYHDNDETIRYGFNGPGY
jgi:hypothetical protein